MSLLTAKDLMTVDVVTVPPETPVAVVARLLSQRGLSAVPIQGPDGRLLGIVTESDLIRRLAGEEDAPQGWFSGLFADPAELADRYARTHGHTAGDIMTRDVVSVTEDANAAQIAKLLEEKHIRRVVVLSDGRLRGIVSRSDLLRAIVSPPPAAGDVSDDRIRRAVLAAMRREPWADTFYTLVEVRNGVVCFHGFYKTEAVRHGLRVLAEGVPGVKQVVDETQPMPNYLFAAA
jgi:CBS domain-containing protein